MAQVVRAIDMKKDKPEINDALASVISVRVAMDSYIKRKSNEESPVYDDVLGRLSQWAAQLDKELFSQFLRGKDRQSIKIIDLQKQVDSLLKELEKERKKNGEGV